MRAARMSDNETIKRESRALRGTLATALESDASTLGEPDQQLLKFHGSYQQDDRDLRRSRREAGLDKAFSFMVRSRIPGGVLSAEQYLTHDRLATQYGNGSLRLTTRQSIQLHGVLKSHLKASIASINRALLSTLAACGDVNRNVMACPAPPLTAAHAEVASYARSLALHLAPRTRAYHEIWLDGEKLETSHDEEEPLYGKTYLPRKFKIGVAVDGDNCVDIYTQDIGFIAELEGGVLRGFTVVIGGGLGSTHGKTETYPRLATPLCFLPPSDVLEIAETILTIQRDYGDRTNRKHARMKYLVEERGIPWFRAELERRVGRCVDAPHAVRFDRVDDHLGWHRMSSGRWWLGILVDNGRVVDREGSRLRSALREVLEQYPVDLRITGQQNLLLTGVHTRDRDAIGAVLRAHGISVEPAMLGIRRRAMACPALPTCGQAVAEAERTLPSLLQAIEAHLHALDLAGEPISIRMTGCPNGCARPRMGDVGIVGRSLGLYDIYLGGDAPNTRLNQLYACGVREATIPSLLRSVFEVWKRERLINEGLGDFAERSGVERLRELAEALQPA
jgi:sulfite reductase (ferredoxin)